MRLPFHRNRKGSAGPATSYPVGARASTDGSPIRETASPTASAPPGRLGAGRPVTRAACASPAAARERLSEARRALAAARAFSEMHPDSPFAGRLRKEARQRLDWALVVAAEWGVRA